MPLKALGTSALRRPMFLRPAAQRRKEGMAGSFSFVHQLHGDGPSVPLERQGSGGLCRDEGNSGRQATRGLSSRRAAGGSPLVKVHSIISSAAAVTDRPGHTFFGPRQRLLAVGGPGCGASQRGVAHPPALPGWHFQSGDLLAGDWGKSLRCLNRHHIGLQSAPGGLNIG